MKRSTSAMLAGAALAGLLIGAQGCSSKNAEPGKKIEKMDATKHACKGQNECKGQGGCKTDKNSCKGQNACKGQGGCKTT